MSEFVPFLDKFQSTRPSRASTITKITTMLFLTISIHKALAGLDAFAEVLVLTRTISIHKALAGLDKPAALIAACADISIHKALAGLDGDDLKRK